MYHMSDLAKVKVIMSATDSKPDAFCKADPSLNLDDKSPPISGR